MLRFAAWFRSRSFNNVLLIWEQHAANFEAGRVPEPFPTYVAGYRQWQQLGRQVEKGQPGYQIFAPVTGRFASANPADPASGYRLARRGAARAGRGRNGRMKPTSLASSVACCGPKPRPGIGAGKRYVVDLSA